ncbi:MAG: PKD domain-containing protein [Candidatus Pedobacter colombiensis]|uniref:PKD domain-containing protein n=1 Tax=Candidatus Pedobacter colombiensis TaxID=3121371 RepID=A0AAJ6B5Z4_9SPHI|nr:PKD domain-containing protein [Pedobacter sp.]WEK19292.1 MAG: PKD domain-containing protein [Pedobacter sp.]
MSKIYSFLTVLLFVAYTCPLKAQRNLVQVNPYSGTASVVVPIYTIQNGAVSTQIGLINAGRGIKVKDVEGTAGMGWEISGGGEISREIRGLPDDCQKDNSNNIRLGWLYNSNGIKIDNFIVANDGNTTTCTDETTDITSLNANFSDLSDTEPDLFSVNAPGLSFNFVFDKNHQIQTIPYQDLKISYSTNSNGNIDQFTVINDQGIRYQFEVVLTTKSTKQTLSTFNSQSINESNISYFRTRFLQYKSGISSYNSWQLTSLTDANHNKIEFSYEPGPPKENITPIELYVGSPSKTTQYWIKDETFPSLLSSVYGGGGGASFSYSKNYHTTQALLNAIQLTGGACYFLNYSSVIPLTGNYSRFFLRDITTDQCNSPEKYKFTYNGEISSYYVYRTSLGDSSSKSIDYWGYANSYSNTSLLPALSINPSNGLFQRYQVVADNIWRPIYSIGLSGADRRSDPTVAAAGSVSQINYLDHGTTTLIYEPHDYYDPLAGTVVQGGGVRIKQVIDYDGIDVSHNMVSNYSYKDPVTGISSGKPTSLPIYGFTRPYTGNGTSQDLWTQSTVRSEIDLSSADHSIVYSHVAEAKTGAGKMVYEYAIPATNYDMSASPSCLNCATVDWAPTVSFVARPGCTAAGFMKNDKVTYPFAPNTNYDFERGLLKSVKVYNETGAIVDESTYSYQRTGTPISITGLRWDENGGFKVYSKYTVYAAAGELQKTIIKKTTDLAPYSQVRETSNSYFYDSPFHRLTTRQEIVRSDGTIEKQFIKYAKDYNTANVNDDASVALRQLQLENQNIPVEQYVQVQKPNQELKVTSGSLVKFKAFNFDNYSLCLPSQKLSFISQNGIAQFTPSDILSGNFSHDVNYIPLENYLLYDANGFLQTKDDHHKRVNTVLSNPIHHFPVANIQNASADEIGYYNPNNLIRSSSFTVDNGIPEMSSGRSGAGSSGVSIHSGVAFSKAIKKNKSAKNYIFSVWINSGISGTISVVLTGTDNIPYSYSLNFIASNGSWKYHEIKVPVSSLSPTFNIGIKNNAVSTFTVTDVLFYPESSEIITSDYRMAMPSKIVETNTNGISEYYESDKFGRLNLVYDQDKQIKSRTSYQYLDTYETFSDPTFSFYPVKDVLENAEVRFYNDTYYNPCQFTGVTFTWNFGDGSSPVVTTNNFYQSHTYTTNGTYTVSLTVTALGYSSRKTTAVINVVAPPIPPDPPLIVPVVYQNTSSGSITSIQLSQNGVVKYEFTGTELSNGDVKVPEGAFRVRVFCSGTYGSVKLDDGDLNYCSDHFMSSSYTFLANLTSSRSLTISIENGNCN